MLNDACETQKPPPAGGGFFIPDDRYSGAHLVLDLLGEQGVDVAFGYPGGAIMPLYDALYGASLHHVLVRHEQTAAFAAGAYARATGRHGVCIATSGPGATNLVTGITDAMMDSVPLVAITGQVKTHLMGTDAFQEADVAAITQPITKRSFVVRDVADLAPTMRAAFRLAKAGRPGPVLVDIPQNILKGPAPRPSSYSATYAAPAAVDPEPIAAAVELLSRVRRPVAIAGGGARIAGATEEFRELCELLGLPHACTINALGCAHPDDPAFLGMLGMHGWKAANLAVGAADAILALGMRFDDRVTGRTDRFARNAHIIHADIDPSEFAKTIRVDVALHGDLKATLRALIDALPKTRTPRFDAWAMEAAALGGPPPRDPTPDPRLRATDVLDAFFARIAPETIVATDVGQHQMWAAQRARPADPRCFITSAGLGTMGFGLGAAIGAQTAFPQATVVAIVGDGGLQMSLGDLTTLRRYQLPVKIVLLDNRNLGMVRQWQQLFYNERYSATNLSDNPDFCAIARACGVSARSAESPEDLDDALTWMLEENGPALLHCACYPVENVWPIIPPGAAIDEAIDAPEEPAIA